MIKTNPVPRIAAIHDLSGFGRSSLTVVIPVLSTMGIQVCPLPTAILSTHTSNFENYHFTDFTAGMEDMIRHWRELGIQFDAVYSGFLGSAAQIQIVSDFIDSFQWGDPMVVIDPVLGDDGVAYDTIDENLIKQMRALVSKAQVITPNITEAAFLLEERQGQEFDQKKIKEWCQRLSEKGPQVVVITSVPLRQQERVSTVVAYNRKDQRFWGVNCSYVPAYFPGTGDIFTSVLTGCLLQGDSLPLALNRGVQFVSQAIHASFGHDFPLREGVLLEKVLNNLTAPVLSSSFELLE